MPRFAAAASLVLLTSQLSLTGFVSAAELRIRIPDGFQIEQIAGPPLVERPISIDFDEQGRMYVAESSGSNDPIAVQNKKLPHRILRLVDTDGDGRFDERTVFADKMMLPEGAMWHDGSLYVGAPPHIWKLTDADGDGVAEQREQWFQGQTLGGCANDMHGPYLGPDGWFYWCKGEFAQATYERPGKKPLVTKAAHVFRRRPEGGHVEIVLTGGMNNPVEVAFSRGGEPFLSSTFLENPQHGKRDGLAHIIYGGVYGKQFGIVEEHPRTGPLLPVLTQLGSAAPCGLARLETDSLGKGFAENLLVCEFNTHKVSRHVLVPNGASFTTKDEDFIVSSDVDFHPTDVLEDADGSVLMVDTGGWYKVCCPTSQLHKPDVLGAIYRIRKTGAPRMTDPRGLNIDWPKQNAAQLAALLSDSRFVVRRRAAVMLGRLGTLAVPPLAEVLKSSQSTPARLEAVWALTQNADPAARTAVHGALADSDEQVRQAALHSVALGRDATAAEQLKKIVGPGNALPNRRAAAEALGRIGNAEAVPALLAAAADAADRALEHSLIYALMEINDPQAVRGALSSSHPHTVRVALIALDQMDAKTLQAEDLAPLLAADSETVRDAAGWVAQRHQGWAGVAIQQFSQRLLDPQTPADSLGELAGRLAHFAGEQATARLVVAALKNRTTPVAARLALLKVVAAAGPQLPGPWPEGVLAALYGPEEPLVTRAVSTLRGLTGAKLNPQILERLKFLAADAKTLPAVRLEALATVLAANKGGSPPPLDESLFNLLLERLTLENPLSARLTVVDILAGSQLAPPQRAKLCEALATTGTAEMIRILPLITPGADADLQSQLLAALAEHASLTSLDPAALRTALAGLDPARADEVNKLVERIQAANADKLQQLNAMLEAVKQGDASRGQQVFYSTKASCSACHTVGYLGGNVGPGLGGIGRVRTERDLLEAVLFPSASFVRTFEPVIIDTKDGLTHTGIIKDETEAEVMLAIDAEKTIRIPVTEIEQRSESKVSIMPAGLDKQLTQQELADLIVFLKSAE